MDFEGSLRVVNENVKDALLQFKRRDMKGTKTINYTLAYVKNMRVYFRIRVRPRVCK